MTKTQAMIILRHAELSDVADAYQALQTEDVVALAQETDQMISTGLLIQDADGFIWSEFETQDQAWAVWNERN
jgi:hypothetical protein